MANKKELEKLQAERHQLIIQELLRDEDNKYCVDCDAKGMLNFPDTFFKDLTMRDMGNSRARAIYEARLPDNFRRPQTDSALEAFIRSKYEHKRYIAQEYVPSKPDVESLMREIQKLEQANKKQRHTPNVSLNQFTQQVASHEKLSTTKSSTECAPKSTGSDLLGLGTAESNPVAGSGGTFNQVADEDNVTRPAPQPKLDSKLYPQQQAGTTHLSVEPSKTTPGNLSDDLLGLDLSSRSTAVCQPGNPPAYTTRTIPNVKEPTVGKTTKDAILALYQKPPQPISNPLSFVAASHVSLCPTGEFAQFGVGSGLNSEWPANTSAPGQLDKSGLSLFSDLQLAPCKLTNMTASQQPSVLGQPLITNSNTVPQQTIMTGPRGQPAFFQQTPTTTSSSFAIWPDSGPSWPQSGSSNVFQPNFVATPGVAMNAWNSAAPPPAYTYPTTVAHGFTVPSLFGPGSGTNAATAHQAYLSQVQSQLASLQLSSAVNNQQ
ncbi:stromal membrane-associated protein [Paragonimus westermani]|uniref:Stromal membrane-associated protein n=1 Tax=Paragonimus westermani TaxID=34504 RepID=A0A5J4NU74_9TREM|nr:stromal membrane-associated protein [Paragonimus westermani]